jgi:DNA polymerase elongation subunit (family B)
MMHRSVHEDGRTAMLEYMHALLEEADAVVHYNGARFDIPTLNKEFVLEGMTPPAPFKQIDLMRTVKRQFRFPSNKLDYVCGALGLGTKVEHKGHKLFIECMDGDPRAWKIMKRYNKQDVVILERLYYALLPWIYNHPNYNQFTKLGAKPVCVNCGGKHLQSRGTSKTKAYEYDRYQCVDCGAWSRGVKTIVRGKVTIVKDN